MLTKIATFLDKSRRPEPRLPVPHYKEMPARVPAATFPAAEDGVDWYPPVMIDGADIGDRIVSGGYIRHAVEILRSLSPDPVYIYLDKFLSEGLTRYGPTWRYADISVVLAALSDLLRPRTYLEIGVRRGRSMCTVAKFAPTCDVYGFDMWFAGYAGLDNPGPDFVRDELARFGHKGKATFVSGDSHTTVPKFLDETPDLTFELIAVDGDHSELGAAQDLADVLPRLAIGGAIVFDDISHPAHPELLGVWRELVADDPRYSPWSYTGAGHGVGCAIRKF